MLACIHITSPKFDKNDIKDQTLTTLDQYAVISNIERNS